MKGLQRAVEAKADAVAIFASASEGFSQANINCSIAESLDRFRPVVEASPVPVRAYLSCITDCPYDGETDPVQAARIAKDLMALGCYELSLGDTLGRATPDRIRAVLTAVLAELPADKLAGHYHDTSGHAVANIEASLDLGLRVFDASTGGLGGCPYAPGAAGNVATEAVAARLTDLGLATGLDQEHLTQAAKLAKGIRHD
jgi:hydroxymethylglutaryl-CoA lyase